MPKRIDEKSVSFSIRGQLFLWLLLPLIALCSLSTYIAYNLASNYANEWHDIFLVNSADSIAARVYRNDQGVALADIPNAAKSILKHNGQDTFYYQIVDSTGHRLTGDANLPLPNELDVQGPKFRYAELDGNKIRMCRIVVNLGPTNNVIWVQVAETLNTRRRLLRQIFFSILVPQLALVALASMSVWFGIKHGLTPLYRLSNILKDRNSIDFSSINIGRTPSELLPVIEALNELFSNASKFIRTQRQFTGNAAHQLRTPITALTTYVDCARKLNKDPALEEVLDQISNVTDRTGHIVGKLLALARSEGRIVPVAERVDLVSVVTDVASCLIPQALEKQLDISFDIPQDEIVIMGNRGDLEELIINLLDNAITYTPQNGSVKLEIKSEKDQTVLSIEDTGPGIPDDQKEKIFERFYRASTTNTEGCGLGLSIVFEVAKLFKTKVQVSDGKQGGARFSVAFQSFQLSIDNSKLEYIESEFQEDF